MADRNGQRSNDTAALTRDLHNPSQTAASDHLLDTDIELDPLRTGSGSPPVDMASSNDAVFVSDVDVERDIREREGRGGNGSTTNAKLRSVSPTPLMGEEAPLLSDAGSSYNGRESTDNPGKNGDVEWHGHAELRGLPWWKKPSVGTFHQTWDDTSDP
jgi:hypothetical protein